MAIHKEELFLILRKRFPSAEIKLEDLTGKETNYLLEITDPLFNGIPLLEQHKIVNSALFEVLVSKLHAITIRIQSH